MSDEADFLARWSKRKSQARVQTESAENTPPPIEEAAASPQSPGPRIEEEEEIPVEDLPPIECIDASTDLTPWLKKKVPPAWRQAALRRVWAADPAISQFVGLADYAWDWNTPGGVPGSGPLRATDNVAELLAQAIGQSLKPDMPEPGGETALAQAADPSGVERASGEETAPGLPKEEAEASPAPAQPAPDESLNPDAEALESNIKSPNGDDHTIVRRRRGGGALPS